MKENREKDNAEPETLFGEIKRMRESGLRCLGRNNVGCGACLKTHFLSP